MRNVPAAADAALGADLFQILTEDAADTVFSPASVASALRIALCGARGQTAAELARVLHLDEDPKPQDAAAAGLRQTLTSGGAGGGSATFRAPNTVWIQSGLPVSALSQHSFLLSPPSSPEAILFPRPQPIETKRA